MATTASAARHSGPGVQAWLAGCSEFSRGVLAVHWQPCSRAFVKGRRGGGAHQPGPGSRYRIGASPRLSSRASSFDTAHLRISWESRTLRCTAQSLSTRPAPMAALELLSPAPQPFATVCRFPARIHGVLRSSPRKSRAPSPRTSELAYHLLRQRIYGRQAEGAFRLVCCASVR
jgi:hypothetical protein